MPPIKQALYGESWTMFSSINNAMTQIGPFVEQWRNIKDQHLLALFYPADFHGPFERKPFEVATTLFKCKLCPEPISHPTILMHGRVTDGSHLLACASESEAELDALDAKMK